MIPLKYATASQEIPLGTFLDSTDGDSEELLLTIANTDIRLWKSGATSRVNKNAGGATHMDKGEYYAVLDDTDTNTYGPMKVTVHVAGALVVVVWCLVMEANAYDALMAALGTGYLESNAVQISGSAPAANNLELAALAYSVTRGLTGTAVPAAIAGAAGGIPLSADGSLDLDAMRDAIDRNAFLIESQRASHTWQGNYYYVDPVNGDTHANGARGGKADPYSTVQDCHDNAITDSNHDVIFLVSGAAGTVTTLTEDVALTKRYFFIRGPGRDFIWTRAGNGDTIALTGDGIELSGFQLETAATGAGDGISATGADFLNVHNVWINQTQGDGIHLLRCSNAQIRDNTFQESGQGGSGEGIHIVGTAGSSNYNVIENNIMSDVAGDAILIEDGNTLHTIIQRNTIHGATGYGVNIGASSTDALVTCNAFGNNTSGAWLDNGTTSVIKNNEQWAKAGATRDDLDDVFTAAQLTAIAFRNADEILTGATHNIATSWGRRVRELTDIVTITGTSPNSGGTTNTSTLIELDSNASAVDGAYDPSVITIVLGTGAGQSRQIFEYDGTNKLAYVNRDWKVIPDDTSQYIVTADSGDTHVNEGVAQAGGPTSITLNTLASAVDETYTGQVVFLFAGTGADQTRRISAYNGTTKVATVAAWQTNPDSTTIYAILPLPSDEAAIKAKTDNLPEGIKKNQAFTLSFTMIDENDNITPLAGLTVAGSRSIDGVSFTGVSGSVSEISNGWYYFEGLAADSNGTEIAFLFSATGADNRDISVKTSL